MKEIEEDKKIEIVTVTRGDSSIQYINWGTDEQEELRKYSDTGSPITHYQAPLKNKGEDNENNTRI